MAKVIVFVNDTSSKANIPFIEDERGDIPMGGTVEVFSPRVSVDDIQEDIDHFRDMGRGDAGWKDVECAICDSEVVDTVVKLMTKFHPGKEIYVAEITKVFTRAVGDLIEKQVSKSGVLPF